jgi:hypothetical protein
LTTKRGTLSLVEESTELSTVRRGNSSSEFEVNEDCQKEGTDVASAAGKKASHGAGVSTRQVVPLIKAGS